MCVHLANTLHIAEFAPVQPPLDFLLDNEEFTATFGICSYVDRQGLWNNVCNLLAADGVEDVHIDNSSGCVVPGCCCIWVLVDILNYSQNQ